MKIGFVFDDSLDSTDGIQQYMFSLLGWLTDQGHEVHFLVGETKRTDIPHVHSLSRNIHVRFNGNRMSIPLFGSRRRIREVLQREQFDVLHVQVPYHPFMAGWVMRLAPPKTVVFGTFHIAPYSRLVTQLARIQAWLSRPSQRRFDQVVSVSPAAADMARTVYGLQTDVVPNVFDYHRFHDAQPLERYADDTPTIVFLGRLVARKGCRLLLEAVSELRKRYDKPFRAVICGGGPLEEALKKYVSDQNLTEYVSFVGRISEEDKPRYLAAADITVLPSSGGESFGIVLLEGMASGHSAVLGGNNPGYRSVLGPKPELLIDPHDANALAQKLQALLENPAERQALAAWGQQESAQYDVDVVGKELLRRYQSLAIARTEQ